MIIRGARRFGMVIGIWLGLSLAATAVPGLTDRVDVLFPPDSLMSRLPEDVRILATSARWVTLISERRDLTLSLYRSGAFLVIPSNGAGCIDLKRK